MTTGVKMLILFIWITARATRNCINPKCLIFRRASWPVKTFSRTWQMSWCVCDQNSGALEPWKMSAGAGETLTGATRAETFTDEVFIHVVFSLVPCCPSSLSLLDFSWFEGCWKKKKTYCKYTIQQNTWERFSRFWTFKRVSCTPYKCTT